MSAVLQPSSGKGKPPEAPTLPSPAAANAAAASFAALTARLDYLDAADIEQVRKAYRFADEAHLGQIRASGEPYITHPCLLYTSPSPRDGLLSRMPSSA